MQRRSAFGLVLAVLATTALHSTHGGDSKPAAIRVHGVEDKVGGKTVAQWSAEWWKWAIRFKKDRNPVMDATGEFADVGQPDAVWFLAGNFGGVSKRKCTIPASRPVLVPVFNYYASAPFKELDEEGRAKFTKAMAAEAKEVIDRGEGLSLELNGTKFEGLEKRRYVSPLFETVGPDKDAVDPSVAGKQMGVSDGYWVLLQPLPEGKHTVRMRSKLKAKKGEPAFDMDVSYEIIVKAAK